MTKQKGNEAIKRQTEQLEKESYRTDAQDLKGMIEHAIKSTKRDDGNQNALRKIHRDME